MLPVCAAQVHPAQAIYLFPLAFPKSASAQTAPQARRHLQLQPGRVLLQVRRGQRRVPRRRRVSVCVCGGKGEGVGSANCSAPGSALRGVAGQTPGSFQHLAHLYRGSCLYSEVFP